VTYRTLQQGIDWLAEKGYTLPEDVSCGELLGDDICHVLDECGPCPLFVDSEPFAAMPFLAWAIDALMKAEERVETMKCCGSCRHHRYGRYECALWQGDKAPEERCHFTPSRWTEEK
jgi:hypothetical protein